MNIAKGCGLSIIVTKVKICHSGYGRLHSGVNDELAKIRLTPYRTEVALSLFMHTLWTRCTEARPAIGGFHRERIDPFSDSFTGTVLTAPGRRGNPPSIAVQARAGVNNRWHSDCLAGLRF